MILRDVMTSDVRSIKPDATIQEAAKMMRESDFGAIPVCDKKLMLGMITDRDIAVRSCAEGQDPCKTPVKDVMTNDFVFCYETDGVNRASELMESHQIRRLPIVDREGKLCGIVSLGDLAIRHGNQSVSAEILHEVSEPAQAHA